MKQASTRSAAERILDRAIELTFPASDPIAVEHAFRSKLDRVPPGENPPRRQTRRAKPERTKAASR